MLQAVSKLQPCWCVLLGKFQVILTDSLAPDITLCGAFSSKDSHLKKEEFRDSSHDDDCEYFSMVIIRIPQTIVYT